MVRTFHRRIWRLPVRFNWGSETFFWVCDKAWVANNLLLKISKLDNLIYKNNNISPNLNYWVKLSVTALKTHLSPETKNNTMHACSPISSPMTNSLYNNYSQLNFFFGICFKLSPPTARIAPTTNEVINKGISAANSQCILPLGHSYPPGQTEHVLLPTPLNSPNEHGIGFSVRLWHW